MCLAAILVHMQNTDTNTEIKKQQERIERLEWMTERFAHRPTAVLIENVKYITNWMMQPEIYDQEYRDVASEGRILAGALAELMRRGAIDLDEVS